MNNKWGNRDAKESAKALVGPQHQEHTLLTAGLHMVTQWANSNKEKWPVAFGALREVLERDYPQDYWDAFRKGVEQREVRNQNIPMCGCGSKDVVAISNHGNFCSTCLHKQHL